MNNDDTMITRLEFDSHRKEVSKDVESLASAIREESKARSLESDKLRKEVLADTKAIRQDIKDLVVTQTASEKPQYQALAFSFGILTFVIMLTGGIYTYMQTQLVDAHQHFEEVQADLLESRHAMQDSNIRKLSERVLHLERKP